MKNVLKWALIILFFQNFALKSQIRTDTLHVIHYDIHLSVLDFSNKKIGGYAELQILAKVNNLTRINLDLHSLTVDSVKNISDRLTFTHDGMLLAIFLTEALNCDDMITLRVYYQGVPAKDALWGGFYFAGQYAFNLGVAFTSIPHNFGRVWFPCLDYFTDKSTYSCSVRTSNNKMAICGGVLTDTTHLPDNTIIWHWELTTPIPTYLASIAVGNYVVYEDIYEGIERDIPIAIYAPPAYIDNVASSFVNLKEILRLFENSFGAYQWERVGYVLVNFSSGAMEHATNIAYPQSAVNGNLTYQSFYSHELAHSWFGNLITCEQAEEMWINEGFARYCEALVEGHFAPNDNPYLDGYKCNIRALQASVLQTAHIEDGGYYALNNVPQHSTYGATSYDKGALVVHTLRNYLGDSLFFTGVKQVLENFQFKNINSKQFFDSLSHYTGVNLQNFYEGWVNQPGFLHFSIDSIRPTRTNYYQLFVRQKLNNATSFGSDNKIDITLFDEFGTQRTEQFNYSGEYGNFEMFSETPPLFAVVDFHEKMSDATIDYNYTFTQTGTYISAEAGFVCSVQRIDSAAWLRVEHNFVSPDELKNANENIFNISPNHYWRVEYLANDEFTGTFSFKFKADAPAELDYPLFSGGNSTANLVLLYRRNPTDDWRIIPSVIQGNLSGMIKSTQFRPGEYTLGMGNREAAEINQKKSSTHCIVYPNPTLQNITIDCPDYQEFNNYFIYNSQGKLLFEGRLHSPKTVIPTAGFARGYYLIKLKSSKTGELITTKFIIQ